MLNKKKIIATLLLLTLIMSSQMTVLADGYNPSSSSIPVTYTVEEYYQVSAPAQINLVWDQDGLFGENNKCYGFLDFDIFGEMESGGGITCSVTLPELCHSVYAASKAQLYCMTKYDTPDGTAKKFGDCTAEYQAPGFGVRCLILGNHNPAAYQGNIEDAMSDPDNLETVRAKKLSTFSYSVPTSNITANHVDAKHRFLLVWERPDRLGTYSGNITINFSRYHDDP